MQSISWINRFGTVAQGSECSLHNIVFVYDCKDGDLLAVQYDSCDDSGQLLRLRGGQRRSCGHLDSCGTLDR